MSNTTEQLEAIMHQADEDNAALYEDLLSEPTPEKNAKMVVTLLNYVEQDMESKVQLQITLAVVLDTLRKKGLLTDEEFQASYTEQQKIMQDYFAQVAEEVRQQQEAEEAPKA